MIEPTLITVVIPCINRAHFLKPTIESVLQQDYKHVECIVIDGGSTDESVEILKSYGNRIKWISEPDDGHADAINKGWKMGSGEILAWLNADDVWQVPNAASQVVTYLKAHPDVDVVYGDCGGIDHEGQIVDMAYMHEWDLEYAVENCDHCIPQPAAFIRRSALEKVGYLDTDFYQKKDHELWLRIGLEGKIKYLPKTLAFARRIQGLSQEGHTVAPSCIQVTEKFYTLQKIPTSLIRNKRRSFSNSWLKGMQYAFEGGRIWKIIILYALRAIIVDPTNSLTVLNRLLYYFKSGLKETPIFRLVGRILGLCRNLFIKFQSERIPNLIGDRDIENSWIAERMPCGPGEALDFGTGNSHLPLLAARRGFNVTAIDIQDIEWHYGHPRLQFIQGDLLRLPLTANYFDLIINCSAVEHAGLSGRYGVTESRHDGDLEVMQRLKDLLKPGGIMLLTIPVGQDEVFAPLCRVYGVKRLNQLITGFSVESEEFWVKDKMNRWILGDKETALSYKASMGSWNVLRNISAIGCFVLRCPDNTQIST